MSLLSELHGTAHIMPLVVTPLLDPRESSIGYALRLCDANGYESPSMLLGGIGLDVARQALGGTAPILSALTLKDESSFVNAVVCRAENYSYNLVGQHVRGRHVNLYYHRVCPACIHADGIHDASWHLSIVTHCPTHRLPLVRECLQCGSGFAMNRPGTDRCKCEAPITAKDGAALCSPEVALLFEAVRAKLFKSPEIASLPKELISFSRMDLNELLDLVRAMHTFVARHFQGLVLAPGQSREQAATHVVATALLQVEAGIDVFLEALSGRTIAADQYVPASAFYWFKTQHAKLSRAPGLSFLAKRIDAFIVERRRYRPGQAVMRRQASMRDSEEFLAKWIQADKVGSLTSCNAGYVRSAARLKLFTWAKGTGNRMVVLREEVLRLRPSAFVGLKPEEAAVVADIPVQLFNRLSRSKIHIAEFIPSTGGPHAREDVLRLRTAISNARPVVIEEMGQTVADFLKRTPKSMLNSTRPLVATLSKLNISIHPDPTALEILPGS